MQQLSLFDFGDDTPKQEKKKKPSQQDASPSKQEETNDALENEEVQNSDSNPVQTVPDQETNADLSDPSNEPAIGKEQPEEGMEDERKLIPPNQDIVDSDGQSAAEEDGVPDQIAEQKTIDSPESTDENPFAEPKEDSSASNNSWVSPETNTQNHKEAPTQTSQTESVPETKVAVSQIPQSVNEDIVFSDENVVVKFKLKANTSQTSNTLNEVSSQENSNIKSVGSNQENDLQNQESQAISGAAQLNEVAGNELDTSFPPLSEQSEDVLLEAKTDSEAPITQSQPSSTTPKISSPEKSLDHPEKNQVPDDVSSKAVPKEIQQNASTENDFEDKNSINDQEEEVGTQPVVSHKRGRKSFKEIDAEVDLIDVPSDEELFKKQYYPISVVAKWFRVNNSLLRFWENEFKILKPKKNKKGDRFFRPEDIKNLQIIYYLLRQKKLTINGAIKHLKSKKEHTEVNLQIIQSLGEFKGFLLELRATTEK